ncbi:6-phospho-beta-glucosidase [Dactylosporangium matsuzakiense]|uniref:6-phospho-beta-glucosidase n=1 Tax=Dactylosporangium matsuzakiense TaxID=53360 RepID=A0A9W6KR58_9ACTN|nr:6-phospho-beta-glucosidase [Dactylosporangium matsuzakiense]UWZ41996.1 6-phospho-beta-glucosidase [Dactylosporangium matsuzakiense]GLL04925.1 6-phospho-beta-glucosidase [Dactylosporangium matsuzakiense]
MKIAVVGGGSTYTPELIDGFARLAPFVSEIVLLDPAADRLSTVGAFAQRILRAHGSRTTLRWTADVDDALAGAATVVIQLRVGGQQARISDETFPLACDCVGQETTGAGGFAKALRTVPMVLDIARRADPGAWIVNFTNPVGIVTRALLDDGHRAAGLCNVAIGFQRRWAAQLGVDPAALTLDHVGLNHLTWERAAYVDGVDRLPALLESALDEIAGNVQIPPALVRSLGSVPSYYLRYFYCHDEVVAEERGRPTRGQRVAEIEQELLRLYRDPALDTKPELLGQRGGAFYSEAAVGLIASLQHDDGGVHAVNVRNRGFLPFLADDAVIETTCTVGARGAEPVAAAPLRPEQAGLVAGVSAYEELAVEAAVKGGRDRVYRALLAHPLVARHAKAERLTDDLLAANRDHLAWLR